MRIHSNVIVPNDLWNAARNIAPNVSMSVSYHKSRTHANAFEISMEGNGYLRNSGQYGASSDTGATWDEWGVLIGRLYAIDPEAVWGSVKNPIYSSAEHFHWSTGNRFAPGSVNYDRPNWDPALVQLPADTHKRHSWEYDGPAITGSYSIRHCKKCSAVARQMTYGHSFDEISGAML